jgi:hypothetical protein
MAFEPKKLSTGLSTGRFLTFFRYTIQYKPTRVGGFDHKGEDAESWRFVLCNIE